MSSNLSEFGVLSVAEFDRVLEAERLEDGTLFIEVSHVQSRGVEHCCGLVIRLDAEAQQMLIDLMLPGSR